MAKKNKNSQGSQTPGRTKGANCQATPTQKSFAKRNRSYKWDGYSAWCLQKNGTKKGGKAK